jgi:hypothetical protein
MKRLLPVLAVFALIGCRGNQIPAVAREDLFFLDIGRLEDQIALYNLEGDQGIRRAGMTMRDGFFYISDGNGGKIVQYNSYGELLFMIYNEETNPPPMMLKTGVEDRAMVTRWAFDYPLREPGGIVVDSAKHIYVEDRLPPDRHGVDTESRALLDSVILHFDRDGRFIEYLGQDGIGGSPFPRIVGLYTSVRDELAVVCRLPTGWNVYWFDSAGALLYLFQLKNGAVPVLPGRPELVPLIDTIRPAPDERKLYVKVDYSRDTFDESTRTRTGEESDRSVIWIMNVEDGSSGGSVEVPFYESRADRTAFRILYSMLGVMRGRRVFLLLPVDTGYSILILDADSGDAGGQQRGFIQIDNSELYFNAFDLSEDGILSAMLADDFQVKLVWWRTDRLLRVGS